MNFINHRIELGIGLDLKGESEQTSSVKNLNLQAPCNKPISFAK